jgi:hypothetical protein
MDLLSVNFGVGYQQKLGKKKISFSRFGSNEDRSEYSFITNGGKVQIIHKPLNNTAGSNESISK